MTDSLGDRMKAFEKVNNNVLMNRTPVIIRIDGRCFHTFTRGFDKPFDEKLIETMQLVTKDLLKISGNVVLGYTQSDEISLMLKDWQTYESCAFFDNKIQKLCSIFASAATSSFINNWFKVTGKLVDIQFDARCFNIPKEDVVNYFIWRQQDWTRNSIQMAGRAKFSSNEMHGKNCNDIQEMLWSKHNINWNDFPGYLKRGTFVYRDNELIIDKDCPIINKDRDYINRWLCQDEN